MQLGRVTCVRTSLRQWRNGGRNASVLCVSERWLCLDAIAAGRQGWQWAALTFFCDV
jgi:hypothetical protein